MEEWIDCVSVTQLSTISLSPQTAVYAKYCNLIFFFLTESLFAKKFSHLKGT
jgi:hypothetical protein